MKILSRFVPITKNTRPNTVANGSFLLHNEHGNRAVIKADLSDGYINILINGNPNTRREFLAIIKEKFNDINKDNLPDEEAPLKEYPDVYVSHKLLLELERKGKEVSETLVDEELYEFNVKELLKSVSSYKQREHQRRKDSDRHSETALEKRHRRNLDKKSGELVKQKESNDEVADYLNEKENNGQSNELTSITQQDSLAKTVVIFVGSFIAILASVTLVGILGSIYNIPQGILWAVLLFTVVFVVVLSTFVLVRLGVVDAKYLPDILRTTLNLVSDNKQLEEKENKPE